jgi:protein-disulfide isomerase
MHALLAISVLANILLASKLYFADVKEYLLLAMESPPRVSYSDHVRGKPDAKVTVIAYMDFQCPYCARLDASFRSLMQVADARLVYRHFPLDFHLQAANAAEAVECAGAQGKYWEYNDRLFASAESIDGKGVFGKLASGIGLDVKAFGACLASGEFKQRVADQYAEGKQRRIGVTPTFYVNGKRFVGALPDERLRKLLLPGST